MPHSPLDIYAQYRFLDPSVFGLSFTTFRQRYAVWGGYEGRQPIAWINQDELNAKVYSIASRVTKRAVLTLPPVTHVERYCELGAKARAEYKSLERDFWTWVESAMQEVTVTNALVKLLRLQQMTSGFVLGDDGEIHETDSAKACAFADWLEDLALDEPLVVFCRFTHDLDAVGAAGANAGRRVGELSGRRNDLLAWQRGELDVLVVQIQAGAEGIDLTRAAYACYYSLGFSLGQYEQSLARLDRPGQTRPVTYTHFLARGTVDGQVYTALRARKEVVEAILRRDVLPIDKY
jgi:SNF2 family DNA or RNA helicase